MSIIHIIPGLDDPTCGIAVAAKMIARSQQAEGHVVECVDYQAWDRDRIAAADEVWVHSMWTPGVMKAARLALKLGKRLVRMPHGCMDPVKLRHHAWKKMFVAPLERRLFRRASSIIATEHAEVEWITSFVGSPQNIKLISLAKPENLGLGAHGLTGGGVSPERSERRRRLNAGCVLAADTKKEKSPLRFLYVGRLTPLKGVRYLLEALPQDAKLVMIGKDEGELKLCQKIARERGLNVDFRGIVSEEEKERAYAECDVLVLPTLSENFGLVIAEALERGKLVITTDGAPAWEELAVSGQLTYLRGFRDGDDETRVRLLRDALNGLVN